MFKRFKGKKCNIISSDILSNGVNADDQDFKYKVAESYGLRVILVCTIVGHIELAWF